MHRYTLHHWRPNHCFDSEFVSEIALRIEAESDNRVSDIHNKDLAG
jgi:hypothetical protein